MIGVSPLHVERMTADRLVYWHERAVAHYSDRDAALAAAIDRKRLR